MLQTRRSGIFNGVLHSYQSAFKELEFVQQWFATTLELTLAVARHLTYFMNNVTGRWTCSMSSIRVWIFPSITMITHAQTACHHVFCLFKAYLRSCCLRSWLWSARISWFMTAYVIRTLAVKWIHLRTWLIIFRWYKSKTASGQRDSWRCTRSLA